MDVTVSPSTPLPGPGGGAEAGSVPQDALSRCVGPTGKVGLDPDSWGHRPLGWAEGQPSALTGTRMHAQACKSPRSRRVSRHRGVCWGRTRRCLQTPTSPPRPVGEPTVQAPEHPPDGPPGPPAQGRAGGARALTCAHCSLRPEGRKEASCWEGEGPRGAGWRSAGTRRLTHAVTGAPSFPGGGSGGSSPPGSWAPGSGPTGRAGGWEAKEGVCFPGGLAQLRAFPSNTCSHRWWGEKEQPPHRRVN